MKYHRLLAICTAFFLISGCAKTDILPRVFPEKASIDLQGHRGARGLFPENTIPAFLYAIEQKMTTLELDTNLTKEGALIVYHDSVINSALCLDAENNPAAPTRILDMTLEDLKRLDCGSVVNKKFPGQTPVPGTQLISLPEFFDFIRQYEVDHPDAPRLGFNIETKFEYEPDQEYLENFATAMVTAIENAGVADRTIVQSATIQVLPLIKEKNPALKTSALFQPTTVEGFLMTIGFNGIRVNIIEKTENVGADIISPQYLYVNRKFVQACHQKGLLVIPWTVNNEKKMRALLKYGVDGIISDYPDRLYAAYQEWIH